MSSQGPQARGRASGGASGGAGGGAGGGASGGANFPRLPGQPPVSVEMQGFAPKHNLFLEAPGPQKIRCFNLELSCRYPQAREEPVVEPVVEPVWESVWNQFSAIARTTRILISYTHIYIYIYIYIYTRTTRGYPSTALPHFNANASVRWERSEAPYGYIYIDVLKYTNLIESTNHQTFINPNDLLTIFFFKIKIQIII